MRILVTTQQWFPDVTGGAARVAEATAVGLAERGHEVVVLAPRRRDEPSHRLVRGVEVRRLVRRTWVVPHTATDVLEIRRLIRNGADDRFDVALCHGPSSVVGTSSALPRTPIVYVFQASGVLEERFRRSTGLPLVERMRSLVVEPILLAVEKAAAARASRIVVMSEFSQGVLSQTQPRLERPASVVWGGVDTEEFAPAADRASLRAELGVAPSQKLLLTVRRIVSRMGIDLLLSAATLLRGNHPDLRLVVVGDGEMRSSLERERDRLGLTTSVAFLGRVSEVELKRWYQAADLFVLPTVAYEGFGMVTAESLASGTPVVGTRVGATTELLASLDPALLADTPTSEGLVGAIERALNRLGPGLRAECREYAVSRLSWRSALDRWEAALAEAATAGQS